MYTTKRLITTRSSSTGFQGNLSVNQLQVGLKEHFGVDYNEADLTKPSQVMQMLSVCFYAVKQISYNQIKTIAQEIIVESPYQCTLPLEALEQITFEKYIRKFLREIGHVDFSFRDLNKPEPMRIKKILAHILNFVTLTQPALKVKKECEAAMDKSIRHKLDLEERMANLANEMKETVAQQKEDELLARKINEDNEIITQEVNVLKKSDHAAGIELDEIRKQKHEWDKVVEGKKLEVKVAKEEVELSKQCIIDDPQKMRDLMSSLRNKANAGLGQVIATRDKMRENNKRAEELMATSPEIENCIKLLNECKQIRKTANDCKRSIPALEDTLEKKSAELKSKNISIRDMEQRVQRQVERLEKLTASHEQQRKQLLDRLDVVKRQYSEWTTDRTGSNKLLDGLKREYKELVAKTQEVQQSTKTECSLYMRLCIDVTHKTDQYIAGMKNTIESATVFYEQ